MRLTVVAVLLLLTATLLAAEPSSRPISANPFAFLQDFHIAHYLQAAVDLQKLDPDARTAKLKELAADPDHGAEVYVLCRMLFDAKPGGTFRRPLIGGPSFIDGGQIPDWPLEPITLHHDIPILVAMTYRLAGEAESPERYLGYCLSNCAWRDVKYEVPQRSKIKQEVEDFIAAHPKIKPNGADTLRAQAE